jgi:hypothetical protein
LRGKDLIQLGKASPAIDNIAHHLKIPEFIHAHNGIEIEAARYGKSCEL